MGSFLWTVQKTFWKNLRLFNSEFSWHVSSKQLKLHFKSFRKCFCLEFPKMFPANGQNMFSKCFIRSFYLDILRMFLGKTCVINSYFGQVKGYSTLVFIVLCWGEEKPHLHGQMWRYMLWTHIISLLLLPVAPICPVRPILF